MYDKILHLIAKSPALTTLVVMLRWRWLSLENKRALARRLDVVMAQETRARRLRA